MGDKNSHSHDQSRESSDVHGHHEASHALLSSSRGEENGSRQLFSSLSQPSLNILPSPLSSKRSVQLSNEQLDLLKSQIMAFKLISSNMSLPEALQQKLTVNYDGPEALSTLLLNDQEQNTSYDHRTNKLLPRSKVALKLLYNTLQAGQNAQNNKPESIPINAPQNLIFPKVIPDPLDHAFLIQEREKIILISMNERIRQLENLNNDLIPPLKLKALIELKGLKLAAQQKKVTLPFDG
jgi:hypothetical protein